MTEPTGSDESNVDATNDVCEVDGCILAADRLTRRCLPHAPNKREFADILARIDAAIAEPEPEPRPSTAAIVEAFHASIETLCADLDAAGFGAPADAAEPTQPDTERILELANEIAAAGTPDEVFVADALRQAVADTTVPGGILEVTERLTDEELAALYEAWDRAVNRTTHHVAEIVQLEPLRIAPRLKLTRDQWAMIPGGQPIPPGEQVGDLLGMPVVVVDTAEESTPGQLAATVNGPRGYGVVTVAMQPPPYLNPDEQATYFSIPNASWRRHYLRPPPPDTRPGWLARWARRYRRFLG